MSVAMCQAVAQVGDTTDEFRDVSEPSLSRSLDEGDMAACAEALKKHHQALSLYVSEWILRQEHMLATLPTGGERLAARAGGPMVAETMPDQFPDLHDVPGYSVMAGTMVDVKTLDIDVQLADDTLQGEAGKSAGADMFQNVASMERYKDEIDKKSQKGHRRKDKSCLIHHPMGVSRTSSTAPSSRYHAIRTLAWFENTTAFHWVCTVVILLNTFVLTYVAEQGVQKGGEQSAWTVIAELCFCVFYTFELALRVVIFQTRFLWCDDWGWNAFDLALVLTAWPDIILSMQDNQDFQNLSYLRLLRIVKMLKVLRIIRLLRTFREFRLLMESILGSVKSIIWSAALILILAFMFSVGFVQAHTSFLADYPEHGNTSVEDSEGELVLEAFATYWNGISVSMLSLYMSSTGGTDWEPVAMPLWHAGALYYLAFIFYIGFFMFVIMNTVTSLFVDSIARAANKDDAQLIQDQLSSKDEFVAKIKALYEEMDNDGDGGVTLESFRKCLSDPRILAFASNLDIEINDMQQFFGILSAGGTRAVDMNTFVVGCIKLRGEARSVDVMDVLITQRNALHEQEQFMTFCREKLQRICPP